MRRRLVTAIVGVASLSVVLFAIPLALVLQRSHRNEELLRLQRDAVAATREIDLGRIASDDPVELPASPEGLAVYDRSGRRVVGRGGPATADPIVLETLRSERPAARAGEGQLVVAVPLLGNEQVTGAVRAQRDDSRAMVATRDAWWTLGGVAAVVVALAALAAAFLGGRLAGPMERLAGAARRLGQGDFAVRAPRAGVREVDDVAAALDAAARRLDDLVSRERAFSADASHQLRTPLAALRIELEAIELRGDAPPELPAALAQVDRLQDTITTLLAVARDAPRSATATPLRPVLDDLRLRWRGQLAATGRSLHIHVEEGLAATPASGAVLREILDVLLDNAHRHGHGQVDVRARSAGGSLAVDVADDGAGLAGDAEAAFGRRTESGHGTGIGLALARALAHAEGARLTVTRAAPHPVFTLLLPAVQPTHDGGGPEGPPP